LTFPVSLLTRHYSLIPLYCVLARFPRLKHNRLLFLVFFDGLNCNEILRIVMVTVTVTPRLVFKRHVAEFSVWLPVILKLCTGFLNFSKAAFRFSHDYYLPHLHPFSIRYYLASHSTLYNICQRLKERNNYFKDLSYVCFHGL
jgi:hypothetical protein